VTVKNPTLFTAIGNTPLVEIENPYNSVRILAKLEGNNPGGSVKDRAAWYMIKKAEEDGSLTKEKIILEPTSGNTGIALAMIGAAKGYRVKLVMPGCVSMERRAILEAYGAETVLTSACKMTDGAIVEAHKIVDSDPGTYFMPNQYANPANPLAHYETTGPEIFRQCDGDIDVFCAGMGTTGTLMGTGRFLREKKPSCRIIGIEPVLGHTVQGLKNMQEAIVPDVYKAQELDDKLTVEDDDAFDTARRIALDQGLFIGMSSGAAIAGALKIAQTMTGGTIVTLLPDRGDRYLSTNLFRSMCASCPP